MPSLESYKPNSPASPRKPRLADTATLVLRYNFPLNELSETPTYTLLLLDIDWRVVVVVRVIEVGCGYGLLSDAQNRLAEHSLLLAERQCSRQCSLQWTTPKTLVSTDLLLQEIVLYRLQLVGSGLLLNRTDKLKVVARTACTVVEEIGTDSWALAETWHALRPNFTYPQ